MILNPIINPYMKGGSRPKQPQCGSLPASHAGKEGLGIWPGLMRIYAWNAGVLNNCLIITFYPKYFLTALEVRLEVWMLTPTW